MIDTDTPQAGDLQQPDELSEVRPRLIAEARKYRKRAQEAERRLAELAPRVLDEADCELFERLKADSARFEQERQAFRQQLAELTEQHSGKLAASNARAARLNEMLSGVVVTDRLKTALAGRGVKRVDQAARLLSERLEVNISEQGYQVQVSGDCDDPGAEITVDQMVDNWLADNRHYLPPSGDTGSGAYPGGGAPRAVSIEQLDLNPVRKAEFVARHGPAALVQLARSSRKPSRR
ncbi:MAG: hypothetical protein QGH60_19180 [Phycisphaerae bacterium]|jgi:hypothetical protein|nr:hypothetical protein [Phycisphaerae bacterium]